MSLDRRGRDRVYLDHIRIPQDYGAPRRVSEFLSDFHGAVIVR
jgi:hypothetical protein